MTSTYSHRLPFGAELSPDGTTAFRVWAPSVEALSLRLPSGLHPMQARQGGWHALTMQAKPGTPYVFVTPDGMEFPDPASRQQQNDVHDPSVVIDPASYTWRNPAWSGRPWHESVIYECHAGLMGGFKGIEARLPELARIGFTTIELMPVADVPGARNWGYDGVLPYAPDTALGTPEDLKSMIDTAHGLGLNVMLDVVYNHFGPDGAYIHAFAKPFFRDDIKTPWGAAIDFRRREVRDYFIQNALYWLNEYRFDGLRFDAVHAISEEDFLVELAAAIREGTAGREIGLVLEHENNRAALLGGPPRFDAQWADDLHHCLHVLLTGESEGYYEDFQDATALLVRALNDGFAYQGQLSPHLGRSRGEPSGHLPTTAFVVCLQNHDQIGNRAMGERLTRLARPEALEAATAFLLLTPFIPMLFMGEEHASQTPFLFFTSHNDELAELVRKGRREEFKAFAAFQSKQDRDAIPDPNAPSTYEASRPDGTDPDQAGRLRALLGLRRQHVMPGIPGCRAIGAESLGEAAVKASWSLGTGETLTLLLNLGARAIELEPSARQALFATKGATAATLPPNSAVALLG